MHELPSDVEPIEAPLDAPEIEKISGKRLSLAQRKEVCDLYAAGKMKVTALADKYGVTKSAISQLLKKEGVTWASRIVEEAKAEVEAALKEKPPEKDPTFSEKRMARIEQTREESYNAVRLLRIKALRMLTEAERMGSPIATLKEAMNVLNKQVLLQINAGKFLLEVLDANQHTDERDLPNIVIRDLADEEIESLVGLTDDDEEEIEEDDEA